MNNNSDWQVALVKTHLEDFREYMNTSLISIDMLKKFCFTWRALVNSYDEVVDNKIIELYDKALNETIEAISIIEANSFVMDYHQIADAIDNVKTKHKSILQTIKDMSDIVNELFENFQKEYQDKKDNR